MATTLTPPLSGSTTTLPRQSKPYDFLLKFLLVGDSDVGKEEILSGLIDGSSESPYGMLLIDYSTVKPKPKFHYVDFAIKFATKSPT